LDPQDHTRSATVTASSEGSLCLFPQAPAIDRVQAPHDPVQALTLDKDVALMLPLTAGPVKSIDLFPTSQETLRLHFALHAPDPKGNYIPGKLLKTFDLELTPFVDEYGQLRLRLPLDLEIQDEGFHFLVIHRPNAEGSVDVAFQTTSCKKVGVKT